MRKSCTQSWYKRQSISYPYTVKPQKLVPVESVVYMKRETIETKTDQIVFMWNVSSVWNLMPVGYHLKLCWLNHQHQQQKNSWQSIDNKRNDNTVSWANTHITTQIQFRGVKMTFHIIFITYHNFRVSNFTSWLIYRINASLKQFKIVEHLTKCAFY